MPRRFRYGTVASVAVAILALVTALTPPASRAAEDKLLQRVKGVVGYQSTSTAPVSTIVGRFELPDDYFAITRAQAAALLTLPDSSIVALGENTNVQVGAFNQTAAGPGSTVTVNGGTLRFDIRRPPGGTANYRFITPTSQIAVRGTVGLLSLIGGNTSVACLVCAADSVSVTVGTQTFSVVTGQLLTVTAAGAVTTGPLVGTALGTFSTAGVSTSVATGPAAATAGVVPGAAGAGSGALTAAVAGAGVVAGVVAAVSNSATASPQPSQTGPAVNPSATPTPGPTLTPTPGSTSTPTPTPAPSATPTQNATPTPVPSATPSATFSVNGKTRAPAAASATPFAPEPPAPERRK